MARLKVFRAQMGFFESVVAAPSQKAALEAWGVRQDLFHEGLAEPTRDPEAVEAAVARPGAPLRRAAGSQDPFTADPAPPQAPERSPPKAAARRPAVGGGSAKLPPPDRSALDAAERALAEEEAERRRGADALAAEQARLDERKRGLETESRDRRRRLERAVAKARRAYENAGGKA